MLQNNSYTHFIEALKFYLFEKYDNNISAFARSIGYSRVYASNIINTTKPAGYEAQVQIASALGYDLTDFLVFGKSLVDGEAVTIMDKPVDDNFIYIPKVEARPAAGNGSFESSDNEVGLYSFRADWIRRMGNPKNMVLMDVVGDSMTPVILDGDTILLDQSKTDLLPNKIFAVRVEDLIYLKYIDMEPGKFILRSHNPDYPPIYVDTEYLHDTSFQILGRAIWWSHAETIKQ